MGVDEVRQAQQRFAAARVELHEAVDQARREGTTWHDIGGALDMTRQAAFKRFGHPTEPTSGAPLAARTVAGVSDVTERAFEHLAHGRHAELHALMDDATARTLTSELLGETWARCLAEVGELESFHHTLVELPDGTQIDADEQVIGVVIGATELRHEAGESIGRVAVDEAGSIIGMLVAPPGTDDLPF